jgi:hypothetical protein
MLKKNIQINLKTKKYKSIALYSEYIITIINKL